MSRQKRDLPAHIHDSVRRFLAEVAESQFEDPAHIRALRKAVVAGPGPIVNIWNRAETAYRARFTSGYLDMPKPDVQPGDGQEWLCGAILASIPEKRAVATTRKQAEQWQKEVGKKLRELELLFAAQPESCARLSTAFAAKGVQHIESDTSWRGRQELLQHPRALRALFYRYRIFLRLLKDSVSGPKLIPENYQFETRPSARTAARNQFMRNLSDEFRSMLGKPKTHWVAHIASVIYGGRPDPKEVRRQLARQ